MNFLCIPLGKWKNIVFIVTVTLKQALKITQQPVSQTVTLGDTITLSLKAEGSDLKYQWYYKKKGAQPTGSAGGHSAKKWFSTIRHNVW